MFVTHLECSLTGELYAADQPHNLARPAGRCLFATTSSERGRHSRAKASPSVSPACGSGANCCRCPKARSRSASANRRRRSSRSPLQRRKRRCEPAGQGRGPPADRVVQGARAGDGRRHGQGARGRAHRHADQRQRRRGACGLCARAPGSRRSSSARPKRRRSTSARPPPTARGCGVADGQIDECGALVREGAAKGCGSIARR